MTNNEARSFPSRTHRFPGTSIAGLSLFAVLRVLDPVLQYAILSRYLGIDFLPKGSGGTLIAGPNAGFLHLDSYHLLILSMSMGSTIKQVFWAIFISQQELPINHAVAIAVFNTVFNSLSTALSLWSRTAVCKSTDPLMFQTPAILIGVVLYTTGILIELVSEIQRSQFKRDPVNAGKPFSGGLFGWARHINYGGYTLWRSGYAWTAAGPVWGLVVGAFFFRNFTAQGIPELDRYCQNRVGPPSVDKLIVCSMEMLGRR
jgi:protein-S-isoprenylcysteine O-methyltransferase Ste14